jgi:hypothetical protein
MMARESLSGTDDRARPEPCKRYAKMILNPKFLAHLPACRACKRVVTQLNSESELELTSDPNAPDSKLNSTFS